MEKSLSAEKCGLSADIIKLIAAAAMLIDHIAWCFAETYSVMGQIMHIIGRITAPVMCFFIAEGFHYTRNVKKYLLRLGIFAVISWVPFVFMEYNSFPIGFSGGRFFIIPDQSVIYTFFLGLLTLVIVHSEKLKISMKVLFITGIVFLSVFGDWNFIAIIFILVFDRFHGNFKKQAMAFLAAAAFEYLMLITFFGNSPANALFQLGVILALIPLYFYNGKRGKSKRFGKWFFYVFYPLHMLVLGIFQNII